MPVFMLQIMPATQLPRDEEQERAYVPGGASGLQFEKRAVEYTPLPCESNIYNFRYIYLPVLILPYMRPLSRSLYISLPGSSNSKCNLSSSTSPAPSLTARILTFDFHVPF